MDFLSFSPDYWDGPRHNRHYFCEALSKRAPVLFASPPFYVGKLLSQFGRGTLSRSGIRDVGPGLVNYVPSKLHFNIYRFPGLNGWLADRRIGAIKRLMQRRGMADPILLLWHPWFRDMIGRFGEQLVIYYVYDQYSGYTGNTPQQSPAELELLKKADLVFVLSRELYESKKPHASRIFHLANAADFTLFSRSRDTSTPIPDDVASIQAPRIGYIGTMNEKLDVGVLEHVASARPKWSIVLAGRENYTNQEQKRRFLGLVARPNVHWLGQKAYDQVPAYIKALDVCLMCYVVNNWTFFGDPSKLHEYLASGKPTVGVGLASIREFSDVVTVADEPDSWVAAIEAGLREHDPALRERRVETARANSYEARIDTFLNIVRDTIGERRPAAVASGRPSSLAPHLSA